MIEKESLKISDTEYYDNSIERLGNQANNSNEYALKRLSPRELKQRYMQPIKMIREHYDALIDLLDGLNENGQITRDSILGLIHTGIPSLPTLYDLVTAFQAGTIPDAIIVEAGKTLREILAKGIGGQCIVASYDEPEDKSVLWIDLADNSGGPKLPEVTEADDGKVLTVSEGKWVAAELPKYDGAYEVTPMAETDQILRTASKLLDADVRISKIPYAEVSNNSGGLTVTIG